MKRAFACLLALLLALTGVGLAGQAAFYQSGHGYTIALPDASWFRLDAATYVQYADTLGAAFAGLAIKDADAAQHYADTGMECFFTPNDAALSCTVQYRQIPMDGETLRATLDGLQKLYEGVMGAEGFAEVDETLGDTRYQGVVYTLEGVPCAQLYVQLDGASAIVTFKGIARDEMESLLSASSFA